MNLDECDRLMRARDHGFGDADTSRLNLLALADEVPGLVAEVRRLNLQIDAIRMRCGRICDESSAALDKAATDSDRSYWGARLRCAQEIAQLIGNWKVAEKQLCARCQKEPVRDAGRTCVKCIEEMFPSQKRVEPSLICDMQSRAGDCYCTLPEGHEGDHRSVGPTWDAQWQRE